MKKTIFAFIAVSVVTGTWYLLKIINKDTKMAENNNTKGIDPIKLTNTFFI